MLGPGIVNSSAQLVRVRAHKFFAWLVRVRAVFSLLDFERTQLNFFWLARVQAIFSRLIFPSHACERFRRVASLRSYAYERAFAPTPRRSYASEL